MTPDERLRAIRDVVQFDIGDRGLARDPERNLINACPDDFANACRSIGEHPRPSIAIVTGFYIADAQPPCGETDGPLGAVFMARSFKAMGIPTQIISDFFSKKSLEVGLQACGIEPDLSVLTIPPSTHPWDVFLKSDWTSNIQYRKLTHLIAIERVGPARDDRCYSMRGRDITDFMCPVHRLFECASSVDARIVTIGIGDGGNEIGMGKIPVETIERNIPNGRQIACRVPADHLIVAGISNWGAYGLAAGVALVRGRHLEPALFDGDREREILRSMVERGPLVDGKTAQPTVTVDGVSFEEYIRALEKIGEIAMAS